MKQVKLQYGHDWLDVNIPFENVTVLGPQFVEGLANEQAAFEDSLQNPINSKPLAEQIKSTDKVAIVIADITRPLPSDRLLSWLFATLSHVPSQNFTIIIGTGTHRPCTPEEIVSMVGTKIAKNYTVINHNSYDDNTMEIVGNLSDHHGQLQFNKEYVQADKRIVVGFIEPHFMAGFSGGYKGVFPAVAGLEAIIHYHRAEIIGHPNSTWGVIDDNPTQAQIRKYGSVLPVDFCINVTLNHKGQITAYFCGDVLSAHEAGCAFVKKTAMVACDQEFPVIITSNSGFPLDQNLYQTVKGICAGAEIVSDDGLIVTVARCNNGFPNHGNFGQLLLEHDSPEALLETIYTPEFHMLDQWQVQKLAQVQIKAKVALYSEISDVELNKIRIDPVVDINQHLLELQSTLPLDTPIAVLPEGPMTIPYIA
jgi:lactate racemase